MLFKYYYREMRSQFRLVPRICYRYVFALFYYFLLPKGNLPFT